MDGMEENAASADDLFMFSFHLIMIMPVMGTLVSLSLGVVLMTCGGEESGHRDVVKKKE
jgi:hypothetical protein